MPGGGSRKKFSDVATLVISRAEVQNGQRKCRWTRVRDYKSVYRCHCAEYFSAYEVREIGHQELVDFLDYLQKTTITIHHPPRHVLCAESPGRLRSGGCCSIGSGDAETMSSGQRFEALRKHGQRSPCPP